MAPPLEHDYIGLSETPAPAEMLRPPTTSAEDDDDVSPELGLKETELKLGLPGSASPARGKGEGASPLPKLKCFVSGVKRGFSDAIDGCDGRSSFGGAAGSEAVAGKDGVVAEENGGGSSHGAARSGAREVAAAAGKAIGPENRVRSCPAAAAEADHVVAPAAKAQVVGWPPIRSYRKNTMATNPLKRQDSAEGKQWVGCLYIKVSMDGAPYLRKVDLKTYCNYKELSSSLENMFSCATFGQGGPRGCRDGRNESRLVYLVNGSEYVLTYEDKDGDWMLVGDVPWDMFAGSCRRLRIMRGSDAIGLAPRAMEKS